MSHFRTSESEVRETKLRHLSQDQKYSQEKILGTQDPRNIILVQPNLSFEDFRGFYADPRKPF